MPEQLEQAFLDAIRAEADDTSEGDAPRLVYADWLTEQGRDAEATLIRLQCAPDARQDLAATQRALPDITRDWADALPVGRRDITLEATWDRGFAEHVRIGFEADPEALAPPLFAALARLAPTLRSLRLLERIDAHIVDDVLPALRPLDQLRSLSLGRTSLLAGRTFDALADLPRLARLELDGAYLLAPEAFDALAQLPLRGLALSTNGLTSVAPLARLSALRDLELADRALDPGALTALEPLTDLRRLVARLPIDGDTLAWLGDVFPRLDTLEVDASRLDDLALARFPRMPALERLELFTLGARVTGRTLIDLPFRLPLLRDLTVTGPARLTPDALGRLARSLTRLDLRGHALGEPELLALAGTPIESLTLFHSEVESLRRLVRLPALRALALDFAQLVDYPPETLRYITRIGLRRLRIDSTPLLRADDWRALPDDAFAGLERLWLCDDHDQLTPATLAQLPRVAPDLRRLSLPSAVAEHLDHRALEPIADLRRLRLLEAPIASAAALDRLRARRPDLLVLDTAAPPRWRAALVIPADDPRS